MDLLGLKSLENFIAIFLDFAVNYSFQLIGAVITLILGLLIARWASKFVIKLCEKKQVDITLRIFLGNVVKILVIVFVLIISMGKFGITVSPFIATLGAITLGLSLALQGLFSNYAAGLIIILTRPFKVGNTIVIKDTSGIVEEVKLSTTILSTEDGEEITIPNKHFLGEILYNSFAYKVVESTVSISYDDRPETAIEIISNILKQNPDVPAEPGPQIGIQEFADSGVNIGYRYWVPTQKYYKIQYKINLSIYNALNEAKVTIPFPQRDVRIKTQSEKLISQPA